METIRWQKDLTFNLQLSFRYIFVYLHSFVSFNDKIIITFMNVFVFPRAM